MSREGDYRDDYPLSESISEAYIDGINVGSSWSSSAQRTEDRDYAIARADRLEAERAELLLWARILARGLWDCLMYSGADVSDYASETRTGEGRDAGFDQWERMRDSAEMAAEALDAVRELRDSYDEVQR